MRFLMNRWTLIAALDSALVGLFFAGKLIMLELGRILAVAH